MLTRPCGGRSGNPLGEPPDDAVLDARARPARSRSRSPSGGVSVRDHRQPAQAEEVGAAVRVRVEPGSGGRARHRGSAGRRPCRAAVRSSPRAGRSSDVLIVPSISLSAMLPVKPSQTTTSAAPASSSRLSVLPCEIGGRSPRAARAPRASAGSPSRAPRRSRAGGRTAARSRGSPRRRSSPCSANWSRCSGRASAFAPESIRTETPLHRGERSGDRGPDARRAGGGSRAGKRPASRPCSRPRRPHRPAPRQRHGTRRRASCPACERTASAGFSSIAISCVVGTSSRPVRIQARRAEQDRLDPAAAASSAPATIASGPRSPPRASTATRTVMRVYGTGVRSGSTSRPRYVPQVGHTRCGRLGWWHCGHSFTRGASMRCVARRLSRRDLEVFRFGTAICSGRL